MTKKEYRDSTIKNVLPNIKYRWPEIFEYTDNQIAACYEDFSMSDDAGNNDECFPGWFSELKTYPKEFN